ncbi:MAG: topoisomerase C-terminal repeat-containing protein [Acidobacteriota bacterium]
MPPDELDLGAALKMLAEKAKGQEALTQDPVTGRDIFLQRGRFGPYLELAQTEEEKESKEKPRRTSLPRGLEVDDLTAPIAQRLIQLPRDLGVHPEDEKPLLTGLGRFGPFLKHGSEFRSLASWEQACDLTIGEAVEILKTPKPTRGRRGAAPKKVIKELGELEGAAGPVQLLEGRYGPYVTDGKTNASLPKGMDPGTVDAAVANKLLTEKRASGGGRKKRTTRRKR